MRLCESKPEHRARNGQVERHEGVLVPLPGDYLSTQGGKFRERRALIQLTVIRHADTTASDQSTDLSG